MLKSVKRLLNVSVPLYPFDKRTGVGTKTFTADDVIFVYPAAEVLVVKNSTGKEIVSKTQLYVDGSCIAKELDEVTFDSRREEIQAVGTFYDHKGNADIKVLYL